MGYEFSKKYISGSSFEFTVGSRIKRKIECEVLYNKEYYSPVLNRGRECDIILITPYRVYCIECKNYKGFINCSYFKERWTFGSSGQRSTVPNPFICNQEHIRAIKGNIYKQNSIPFHIENVIVVPDICKINKYENDLGLVYTLSDLIIKLEVDCRRNNRIYNTVKLAKYLDDLATN